MGNLQALRDVLVPLSATDRRHKFRYHQIEDLLDQAADLLETASHASRNLYSAMESKLRRRQELERLRLANKQLSTEKGAQRILARAEGNKAFFDESASAFAASKEEADKLHSYAVNEGQGMAGWTRAGQNMKEKEIEQTHRKHSTRDASNSVEEAKIRLAHENETIELEERLLSELQAAFSGDAMLDEDGWVSAFQARLSRDFCDALNRAHEAKRGICTILGLPIADVPDVSKIDSPFRRVHELTLWVRDAIAAVTAHRQFETDFSLIRLLPIEGDKPLHTRLLRGEFTGLSSVRLRGLSASVISPHGDGVWSVVVEVPQSSVYNLPSAANAVQQPGLSCRLGRVENFRAPRPRQIGGGVSLANVAVEAEAPESEGGDWSFHVSRYGGPSESSDDEVLVVEFHLRGLPAGTDGAQ